MDIWQLTQNKEWSFLEQKFSWVNDMNFVEQHKIHHAEGNVAIHTQMVLNQLINHSLYKNLSVQDKEILWASALLHDVEKRSTSIDEGMGKISAKGHARKGEYTARSILFKEIPTPFAIREAICSFVRFHGLPLWFLERDHAAKKVHEVSLRANTSHLKLLAEADAKGRCCESSDSLLETLELFELFCMEQNCWSKPVEFETAASRFRYFNSEDNYIAYVPFEKYKCEVTLLSGLPGMGKDHYLHSLTKDIPIVSLDDIRRKHKFSPTDRSATGRAVQMAKEQAREHLRKGQDFVWNATNITRKTREQLIDLFTSYGARVKIVYVEKTYTVWKEQNKKRDYPLPDNVLEKMLGKLEIPQLEEAHELVYLV